MLDKTGNTVKRQRKPRKIYTPQSSPTTTNHPATLEEMSTPITATPPSSASQNIPVTPTPSNPTNEISDEDLESLISEIPNNKDGKKFKQYLSLTRKALVKDFSKILSDHVAALKAENAALRSHVTKLENQIKKNEIEYQTDLNRLEQYGRRSNVEIAGIPDEVSINELENKVVAIFKEMDVKVDPRDIEACHRLPNGRHSKGPARTIVRFVNRKNCNEIFSKKRNLKNIDKKKLNLRSNIYVNYSLCRDYRRIWYNARKLHSDGKITKFWVSNGTVKIALTENSPPISILHKSKLEELFPGCDLDGPISN